MKAQKYIGLSSVILGTSIMMVACADHKGFKARMATPEQIEIQKARKAQLEEQARNNGQGLADGMASAPARARDASGVPVTLSNNDQDVVSSAFASLVAGEVGAGKGGSGAVGSGQTVALTEEQKKVLAKITEVMQASLPQGAELIKGLTVTIKNNSAESVQAEEREYQVTADMLLVFGDKDLIVSGMAHLMGKDLFEKHRMVAFVLNTKLADFSKELNLKGVEVYASCAVANCEQVKILVLITRDDGKKVSMIGVFDSTGKALGTSLGDQWRSLADAQDLRAKESAAAAQAARAEGAAGGGNTAAANGRGASGAASANGAGDRGGESANSNGAANGQWDVLPEAVASEEQSRFPGMKDIPLREQALAEHKKQAAAKAQAATQPAQISNVPAAAAVEGQTANQTVQKKNKLWDGVTFGEIRDSIVESFKDKRWTYKKTAPAK